MRKTILVLAGVGAIFIGTAVPAFAHGGSVSPPTDQVECRDLGLYSIPSDGLKTASVSEVVTWSHCPSD